MLRHKSLELTVARVFDFRVFPRIIAVLSETILGSTIVPTKDC